MNTVFFHSIETKQTAVVKLRDPKDSAMLLRASIYIFNYYTTSLSRM